VSICTFSITALVRTLAANREKFCRDNLIQVLMPSPFSGGIIKFGQESHLNPRKPGNFQSSFFGIRNPAKGSAFAARSLAALIRPEGGWGADCHLQRQQT
jgi:hypothetical protein